ncbi:MAG: hypothetical protein GY832_22185 [Chloroflexi bacterium]|nr:hypothetical protein [Chloroflexota bacterium]
MSAKIEVKILDGEPHMKLYGMHKECDEWKVASENHLRLWYVRQLSFKDVSDDRGGICEVRWKWGGVAHTHVMATRAQLEQAIKDMEALEGGCNEG